MARKLHCQKYLLLNKDERAISASLIRPCGALDANFALAMIQISHIPAFPRLVKAAQYRFEPFSGLTCCFREERYAYISRACTNPRAARVFETNLCKVNFRTERKLS